MFAESGGWCGLDRGAGAASPPPQHALLREPSSGLPVLLSSPLGSLRGLSVIQLWPLPSVCVMYCREGTKNGRQRDRRLLQGWGRGR